MKRIEAIIPHEKTTELNEALKKAGVGGCTIFSKRKVEERVKRPWLNLEEEQLGLCQNSQSDPILS